MRAFAQALATTSTPATAAVPAKPTDANNDCFETQFEQAAYNAKHLTKSTAASKSTVAESLKAYQPRENLPAEALCPNGMG